MASIKVILTEKITGLGAEADLVKVRGGFARNFLLPQGKALEATKGNLNRTNALKAKRVAREAAEIAAAKETSAALRKTTIHLEISTGQGGKSFGSVTTTDIARALLEQANLTVDRHDIVLEKPIKGTGEFEIPVKFPAEIEAQFKLVVSAKADT